ncbi:MAG: hypothetical protein IT336_01830 [Thermomicrobiales bacterium]|nr:hypothetical protein [Thermomicrobiales bacterium]
MTILRALFVSALALSFGPLAVFSDQTLAADPPRLLDQRTVVFDETRIIGISPDGGAIAAASWNYDELCVFETESMAERFCTDLSPLEARLRIDDVAWSPDSSKIALSEESFRYFIDGDLWVLDAVTGELTDLTDEGYNGEIPIFDRDAPVGDVYIDVSPTWLPDSSAVTFSRSTYRNGDWAGNAIYTVPISGGEPELETIVTLDTPGVVYFGMRWTADRSALYYTAVHPSSSEPINGIWRVNADGLDATRIVAPDDELGAPLLAGLSPDGTTLLVHYGVAAGQFGFSGPYLYALYDIPTGTLTPLTTDAISTGAAWPAALSPDGRFVIYVTQMSDPAYQVFIRPVAGDEETPLVPDGIEAGAIPINLAAPITWSTTGTVLFPTRLLSEATLLTIDAGADATPDSRVTAEPTLPAVATQTAEPTVIAQPTEVPSPASTETAPPTETVEPTATPAGEPDLALGDVVIVNDNDVPLRAAPGTGAETIATLALGTELRVLGPPETVDGFDWVPVADLEKVVVGYVRVEFIDQAHD